MVLAFPKCGYGSGLWNSLMFPCGFVCRCHLDLERNFIGGGVYPDVS
jgi:hypothetical protein